MSKIIFFYVFLAETWVNNGVSGWLMLFGLATLREGLQSSENIDCAVAF